MTEEVIDLLEAEWASIGALIDGLDEAEWKARVPLPGWTVQDCVSHVIGVERSLLGDPAPQIDLGHLPWITSPFQEIVEVWVEARRALPGAEVAAEFHEVIPRRLEALRAMSDEDFERVGWSPVGEVPYREFMRVRIFDCWMHEQDMRRGLGRPGHTEGPVVASALRHNITKALGFIVGKRAAATQGQSVLFDLTDPARSYAVRVDGRAALVDPASLDGPPTATLAMPFVTFVALAGGRIDAEQARAEGATITGDDDLGGRVLAGMAFTP